MTEPSQPVQAQDPAAALLPAARTLAAAIGKTPSRSEIKAALRIGSEKAAAVRARLLADVGGQPKPKPSGAALSLVTDRTPVVRPATAELAEPEPEPVATVELAAATETGVVAAPAVAVPRRKIRPWPVLLLAAPAFVAVWSGWVGLGQFTGFGVVHPLPGIADGFTINSAITLPIGVETYAAFALRVWLSGQVPASARRFAKLSAIGSLILGALGQIAYHLLKTGHDAKLAAALEGVTGKRAEQIRAAAEAALPGSAPWWLTTAVACLPVAVLGMGAALAHLLRDE